MAIFTDAPTVDRGTPTTITAPLRPVDVPLRPLDAPRRDPIEHLDTRTLLRLRAAADAPPGRYLAAGAGTDAPLLALADGATHIGRGASAHVRIESHHVSRLHASITCDGTAMHLLDSRSLNGTWVNGERVAYAVLRPGDTIEIGELSFRYVELG